VVHEALGFGHCHLALGVPMGGKFANVTNLDQLRAMDCWTEETPLRVVTGALAAFHTMLGCEADVSCVVISTQLLAPDVCRCAC
jgi:hypothetical protein